MRFKFVSLLGSLLVARAAAAQPIVQVAPEQELPASRLPRETPIENPLGQAPARLGSAIGGYGELTLNAPVGDSPGNAVIDLRRVVLFVGHNFTDKLRFYSELE